VIQQYSKYRSTSVFIRKVLAAFLMLGSLLPAAPLTAEVPLPVTERLTILTSFPPEFYTPFVKEFRARFPSIQISVLNKKTTSAIDEILRGNNRQFDVFWSSSADAFDMLKSAQALLPSQQNRAYETVSFSDLQLDDPGGNFYGFALSGVGWMWNSHYLEKEELPVPESWHDLTRSVYYGHVAMSTPSRSGTTHLIVENFLQQLGWEQGWSQLLLMAGNFTTVTARSFSVPEGVGSGRFGIGLVIDFLARTDKNPAIHFCYGEPVFLVPAGIARLQNSRNPEAGGLFLDFVLSVQGQQILLQPDINRLPVSRKLLVSSRRAVAQLLRDGQQKKLRAYNVPLSRQRYHLVNRLFDRMITFRLRERRQLWKRIIDMEEQYGRDNPLVAATRGAVVDHLGRIPVSAKQAADGELCRILTPLPADIPPHVKQRRIISRWDTFISNELAQAAALLDGAEQSLSRNPAGS